jgi:hypothetical protein
MFIGAGTAALVWLSGRIIARLCTGQPSAATVASTIGALLYALSPLVWEYSTTAEVFALNNFLCAGLLLLLCQTVSTLGRFAQANVAPVQQEESAKQKKNILWLGSMGGLLCGLTLANQHASSLLVVCVVPTVLMLVGVSAKPILVPMLVRAALGVLMGLSTYLYLPWAALQRTPGSWGDLGSLYGIVRHVLRAEYGTFRLGMVIGSETALQRIWIYLCHTSEESFHAVFPILALGAVALITRSGAGLAMRQVSKRVAAVGAGAKLGQNKQRTKSSANKTATEDSVLTDRKTAALQPSSAAVGTQLVAVVVFMWLFYTLVWHCVFSNLPLSSPMPFAVHSRFWMQPNILLYALCCAAIELIADCFIASNVRTAAVSTKGKSSRGDNVGVAVVVAVLSLVLYVRLPSMDKSSAGDVMMRYGQSILQSAMQTGYERAGAAPLRSLLLSHTDLDWNPVRYLQHCEGVGLPSDEYFKKSSFRALVKPSSANQTGTVVTHLNFQLMPYPWFVQTQAPLYPDVVFPEMIFPGVSTDRASEGNAQLVTRFLTANNVHRMTDVVCDDRADSETLPVLRSPHAVFEGGVYLDMQSVQEAEIEPYGVWRGFTLIPWGTQFRVFGKLSLPQLQELHHYSWDQLRRLQLQFPAVDDTFMSKFIPGSWERAAANVFYDSHYQFGVNLLTYCVEMQAKADLKTLPLLLDRYYLSAQVLQETQRAVQKYGTFSGSLADLSKNTSLAWMRLHGLMSIVQQFGKEITREVARLKDLPRAQRSQVSTVACGVVVTLSTRFSVFKFAIWWSTSHTDTTRRSRSGAPPAATNRPGSARHNARCYFGVPARIPTGSGCAGVRRRPLSDGDIVITSNWNKQDLSGTVVRVRLLLKNKPYFNLGLHVQSRASAERVEFRTAASEMTLE